MNTVLQKETSHRFRIKTEMHSRNTTERYIEMESLFKPNHFIINNPVTGEI